jgi:hypothetical protein
MALIANPGPTGELTLIVLPKGSHFLRHPALVNPKQSYPAARETPCLAPGRTDVGQPPHRRS